MLEVDRELGVGVGDLAGLVDAHRSSLRHGEPRDPGLPLRGRCVLERGLQGRICAVVVGGRARGGRGGLWRGRRRCGRRSTWSGSRRKRWSTTSRRRRGRAWRRSRRRRRRLLPRRHRRRRAGRGPSTTTHGRTAGPSRPSWLLARSSSALRRALNSALTSRSGLLARLVRVGHPQPPSPSGSGEQWLLNQKRTQKLGIRTRHGKRHLRLATHG